MDWLSLLPIDIGPQLDAWIWGLWLVSLRIGTAMLLLPGFGEFQIPQRVRLILAFAVAIVIMPLVPGLPTEAPESPADMIAGCAREVLIGGFFGVGARILFSALHVAGQIAGQSMQLANIAAFPGSGFDGGSVIAAFFVLAGLGLVFLTDLHLVMIQALIRSYELLPMAGAPPVDALARNLTETVAAAFGIGVQLAAPFLVIAFVFNLGLGLVNKAMPQMAVFFVGMPIAIGGGLAVLMITVSTILFLLSQAMRTWLATGGI